MTRRSLRVGLMAAVAFLAIAAAYAYLGIARPMHQQLKQVGNLVEMRGYDRAIQQYWDEHGLYPIVLREATKESYGANPRFQGKDLYGHAVAYRSDGHAYLLVSYGRDGMPDGTDYEALRSAGVHEARCKDLDADQIFSDKGELRSCGK